MNAQTKFTSEAIEATAKQVEQYMPWNAPLGIRELPGMLRALASSQQDLIAALQEIYTINTESPGACRQRMGTRAGNTLVAVKAALRKAQGGGK